MAILLFRSRGVVALPGYFIAESYWAGHKAAVGSISRFQGSTFLSGGQIAGGGAQNDSQEADHYPSTGTYTFALIHIKEPDVGIYNVQFNGVTQLTIDGYAAAQAVNTYSDGAGLVVTAGVKTVKKLMATKNASASAYTDRSQTGALARTGA